MNDPMFGQLTFFRVYSGVVKQGDYRDELRLGQKERIGVSFRCANNREEIEEVRCRVTSRLRIRSEVCNYW